jgi:hypothetical protein
MRGCAILLLLCGLVLTPAGCSSRSSRGPTVDAFNGRLTHEGEPVKFPEGETLLLQVFHEKGRSFGIPIKSDGTFQIGWMPIGSYGAVLKRESVDASGARSTPRMYSLPGNFKIEVGKTEYQIDLGKDWQPEAR